MQDLVKKWNPVNPSLSNDVQLSSVKLPEAVSSVLVKAHSWVGSIVDIKILAHQETSIWSILMRWLTTRIYDLLWINDIKPEVFASMTDVLNRQRAILNNWELPWTWKILKFQPKEKSEINKNTWDTGIIYDKAA